MTSIAVMIAAFLTFAGSHALHQICGDIPNDTKQSGNNSHPGLKYNATLLRPGEKYSVAVQLAAQQIMHFDDATNNMIPDMEWMMNLTDAYPDQWEMERKDMEKGHNDLTMLLDGIITYFNHESGVHTVSQIYGCELNKGRAFLEIFYDQELLFTLNLTTATWIPAADHGFLTKTSNLDFLKKYAYYWKNLESKCIVSLQSYMEYRDSDCNKSDQPSKHTDGRTVRGHYCIIVFSLFILYFVIGILIYKKKVGKRTPLTPDPGPLDTDLDV